MSRSKLIRALLAAASLLGAVPLMAQTARAVAATAPAEFPMGRYTLEALDSTHAPPPGMTVEFTSTTLKLWMNGQVVETHGMTVTGDKWQVFEFDGGCTEAGDYRWHLEGTVMWMEVLNDPCTERAQNIASVRFHKEP